MVERDKSILSEFIRHLHLAIKLVQMYTIQHPNSQQGIKKSFSILESLLRSSHNVTLSHNEGNLFIGDQPVDRSTPFAGNVLDELVEKQIESLIFTKKATIEDFGELISVLSSNTYTLMNAGGADSALKQKNVLAIKVTAIKYNPLSPKAQHYLDEMVISHYFRGKVSLSREEKSQFIRELTENPGHVSDILSDYLDEMESPDESDRVSDQAKITKELVDKLAKDIFSEREGGLKNYKTTLTQLVLGLDPVLQKKLL